MEDNKKEHLSLSTEESAKLHTDAYIVCPACGAQASKRRKLCPQCGAPLRATKSVDALECNECEAPSEECEQKPQEQSACESVEAGDTSACDNETEQKEEKKPDNAGYCPFCCAPLEPNAKFCIKCGTPIKRCHKCGEVARGNIKFCRKCGAPLNVCEKCGEPIDPSHKFCRKCGEPNPQYRSVAAPVYVAAPPKKEEKKDEPFVFDDAKKKRRSIGRILKLVAAGLSVLLAFIFMCTPVLYMNVHFSTGDVKLSQGGLTAIGVAFGGKNRLGATGILTSRIADIGYSYLMYIIVSVCYCICLAVSLTRDREKYFKSNIAFISVLFGIAFIIFIEGFVALGSVDIVAKANYYLGTIGVFLSSAAGFTVALVSRRYEKHTYPKKREKVSRERMLPYGTSAIVSGVLAFVFLIVCSLYVPAVSAASPNSAGKAVVSADYCALNVKNLYYGGQVFELTELENGETYCFDIRLGDSVSKAYMEKSVLLYKSSDVKDADTKKLYDLFMDDGYDSCNAYSSRSYARLTFTYTGEPLSVVVFFPMQHSGDSRTFDYCLRNAKLVCE